MSDTCLPRISMIRTDNSPILLTAVDREGSLIDLTGFTLETHLALESNSDFIIDNTAHEIDADQTTNKGQYSVMLERVDQAKLALLLTGCDLLIRTKATKPIPETAYTRVINLKAGILVVESESVLKE